MVRSGQWKLVYHPLNQAALWQLFDTFKDPECHANVIDANPEIAQRLKKTLEGWLKEDQPGNAAMTLRANLA
jgi:hypothetical protein